MKMIIQSAFLYLSILIIFFSTAYGQISINKADNYFFDLDLEKAEEAYTNIFHDDNAGNKERALAGMMLSYIHLHFYKDIEKAEEIAQQTLSYKHQEVYVYRDLIKFESTAERYGKAKKIYREAQTYLKSKKNRQITDIAYADMILKEAIGKIHENKTQDKELLIDALQKIVDVNNSEPGMLHPANIQLGLALLLQKGEHAKKAVHLYYHIPEGENAEGMLKEPVKELIILLNKMDKGNFTKDDSKELIIQLAEIRFYDYARLMQKLLFKDEDSENKAISDICYYHRFIIKIQNTIYNYYKEKALIGNDDQDNLQKEIKIVQTEFWNLLTNSSKKKKYNHTNFKEELYQRFGTKFYIGLANNEYIYLGAHTIVDTIKKIEQFNHNAEIQFTILDRRFSNSYWGWFTGYLGIAGYADAREIGKYREPEVNYPMTFYNKLSNDTLLRKWKENIKKLETKDDSLIKLNPKTNLRGVSQRIRLTIYSELLDSLISSGYEAHELRMMFINKVNEINYNRTINHEGRHAIDFNILSKKELKERSNLEYRAKLSQIFFSKYPLLNIDFTIDNTDHGKANYKILQLFKNWMENNENLIIGFDRERPTLPQLYLLSKKQLKNIIRSADPLLNN